MLAVLRIFITMMILGRIAPAQENAAPVILKSEKVSLGFGDLQLRSTDGTHLILRWETPPLSDNVQGRIEEWPVKWFRNGRPQEEFPGKLKDLSLCRWNNSGLAAVAVYEAGTEFDHLSLTFSGFQPATMQQRLNSVEDLQHPPREKFASAASILKSKEGLHVFALSNPEGGDTLCVVLGRLLDNGGIPQATGQVYLNFCPSPIVEGSGGLMGDFTIKGQGIDWIKPMN